MEPLNILISQLNFLLLERGFVLTYGKAYGQQSGYITLENKSFKIKIVCERAQHFTELAWLGDKSWFELSIVRRHLFEIEIKYMSVEEQVSFLRDHYQSINLLFSDTSEESKNRLRNLRYLVSEGL